MQSSWEVLALLIKVMGAVVGAAVLVLAAVLLARDEGARKAFGRVSEAALVVAHFVRSVVAEYARVFGTACSQYLLSKGKKIAKAFLT